MSSLTEKVSELRKSNVKRTVDARLEEFKDFKNKDSKYWFSELCFCLLTANSKAHTALKIQEQLSPEGFYSHSLEKVRQCIIDNKHRFHNNKSRFIVEARKHGDIKKIITEIVKDTGELEARKWLAENVTGLGYKEASHFMRNVGYTNLAILDRHILRLLHEYGYIKEVPNPLTKKKYLEIEKIFNLIAKELCMNSAELDLYMWYMKTGEILK